MESTARTLKWSFSLSASEHRLESLRPSQVESELQLVLERIADPSHVEIELQLVLERRRR